jgi:hypothetical protein
VEVDEEERLSWGSSEFWEAFVPETVAATKL